MQKNKRQSRFLVFILGLLIYKENAHLSIPGFAAGLTKPFLEAFVRFAYQITIHVSTDCICLAFGKCNPI